MPVVICVGMALFNKISSAFSYPPCIFPKVKELKNFPFRDVSLNDVTSQLSSRFRDT